MYRPQVQLSTQTVGSEDRSSRRHFLQLCHFHSAVSQQHRRHAVGCHAHPARCHAHPGIAGNHPVLQLPRTIKIDNLSNLIWHPPKPQSAKFLNSVTRKSNTFFFNERASGCDVQVAAEARREARKAAKLSLERQAQLAQRPKFGLTLS